MNDQKLRNENTIESEKNLKVNKSCSDLFYKEFEYPFLNRKDLMSLSTINNNDFPIRKFKQIITNRDWSLNLYNLDIEGSSPRKFGVFANKIDFTNKNRDIEKSFPYIPKILKKPIYNLSNEDVEGSKPNCSQCTKISRHTNPLQPKYNLPRGEEFKIEDKSKFIRDNLYIDDIIGSRSKKKNIFLRDSLNKDDLKESFPKKQYFIRKDKYNNLEYNDISRKREKSQRNINPLMPIYNWKYTINNLRYSVGPIEGNTSNPFSKYKYANPYNLRNDDIEGTNSGSKFKFKKFISSNSCLNIGDINGAIHGSLKKGITTKRIINPVYPKYKYPGEDELNNEINIFSKNNLDNKDNNNKNNNIIEKTGIIDINKLNNNLKIENCFNFDVNNESSDIEKDNIKRNKKINKNKSEGEIKIINALSDINEYSPNDNEVKFNKNIYKKPEKYYPLKHEKYIIPKIIYYNNEGSTNKPKVRSFQQVINEKIRFTNQLDRPITNLISKSPKKSYENKMDDFFVKSTINNYRLQQKLKNNINAFYDIGFPEVLKTADIEPKF